MWVFFLLSSMVLFFLALLILTLTGLFDKNRVALHLFSCWWAHLYIVVNPYWSLHIQGREHIQKGRTYVLVSNHQSALDVLILFSLYRQFKWVSKKMLFQLPFIGWNMRLNQYIAIDRASVKSQQNMLTLACRYLESGSSLMMFPEGTRSKDGDIGHFKDGAFRLARENGVSIVPIVLDGSYDALEGLFIKKRAHFQVKILPPVTADYLKEHSVKEIRDHIYTQMGETLSEMRS